MKENGKNLTKRIFSIMLVIIMALSVCTPVTALAVEDDYCDENGHDIVCDYVQEPNCTTGGESCFICQRDECGYSYVIYIPSKHTDENLDGICDECGENSYYITEGEQFTVTYDEEDEIVYYWFTPEETGYYTVKSFDETRSYPYLDVCSATGWSDYDYGFRDDDYNYTRRFFFEADTSYFMWFYAEVSSEYDVIITYDNCDHEESIYFEETEGTCSVPGNEEGYKCDECGVWISGGYPIYKDHKLGGYIGSIESAPPSCDEGGYLRAECEDCDYAVDIWVPAKHTDENLDGICDVCGENARNIVEGEEFTVSYYEESYEYEDKYWFIPEETGYYTVKTFDENGIYPYLDFYDVLGEIVDYEYNSRDENGNFTRRFRLESGTLYYMTFYADFYGEYKAIFTYDNCEHESSTYYEATEATCLVAGVEEGGKCNECGAWLWGGNIYYGDHDYAKVDSQSVAATCTAEGIIKFKCNLCDANYDVPVFARHTDPDADGVCNICRGASSDISEGIAFTVQNIIDDEDLVDDMVRFVPKATGVYTVSGTADDSVYPYVYLASEDGEHLDCLSQTGDNNTYFNTMYVFEKGKTYYLYFSSCSECEYNAVVELTTSEFSPVTTGEFNISHNFEESLWHYYSFVPGVTGSYTFKSIGESDPAIAIYKGDKCIKYYDDGIEEWNFNTTVNLRKGEIYYLLIKDYNDIAQFKVCITHNACTHSNKTNAPQQNATCTATGFTAGVYCNDCESWISGHSVIGKTAHTYNAGAVTKDATCTQSGTKLYACTACKATKTETIAPTGHKETVLPAKAATYTETGLTEGKQCTVCGTVTVVQQTTEKLTLGKPSGLKVKAVKLASGTKTTLTLTWDNMGDGVKYEVYQKNGKKWTKVGKATSKNSVTVKKLKADTSYKFKVKAIADGKTAESKIFTAKTVPLKTTLSLKAGKKQLTASWSTVANITGYEVEYSTAKNFKKNSKVVTIKKAKTKKTTIKKLSKGKKYFVRVRAYKTVDGKKIYGAWSAVKNVKVK